MNRFINVVLVFLFLPTLLLAIYVGFDLPVSILKTTGAEFPYHREIFLGLGLLIFIINLRRSIRRWMGMRIVSNVQKFKWNAAVSLERKKRVNTYLLLESFIMTGAGIGLYLITPSAWGPAFALLFAALDSILFSIIGTTGNLFKIGLTSKALIVADREVIVLYFSGLRKVSAHQQSIYFDYIKGLQLSFPSDCIANENRDEFLQLLEAQFNPDKVFFSKQL